MADPELPTVQERLMRLCDEHMATVQGHVAALYGLAEAVFFEAQHAGTVTSTITGLRFTADLAEKAAEAMGRELQGCHRQAGEANHG